jgi:hypothetical protein
MKASGNSQATRGCLTLLVLAAWSRVRESAYTCEFSLY